MPSAGEDEGALTAYLQAVRAALAADLGWDSAMAMVPAAFRDEVRSRWQQARIVVEPVAVLAGPKDRNDWVTGGDYDPAAGYHWRRLRDFLLVQRGRSESALESLDSSTDRILGLLADPRAGGPARFRTMGLVVGHVQSGKTANFSALTAKAVDAGYRIVIVLSGLHNSLRRQTQLRLEDELGLVQPVPGSKRRSVGFAEPGQGIVPMTGPGSWEDFHPGTADPGLIESGGRLIFIVKKNASVLRRLVSWLEERSPVTPPVLVIDDEADQASINTGGNRAPLEELLDLSDDDVDTGRRSAKAQAEESDPSVINGLLRRLLRRMERVSYVGYTATPFANVLIDRDAVDRDAGGDLYPADFIVALPQPAGYVGTERLFGRAALIGEEDGLSPLDVLRRVPDHEADQLNPGRNGGVPGSLPETLKTALLDFLLAAAARDTREGARPATSMLIHASPFTAQQVSLAALVVEHLATLRQQWRYDRDAARREFRARWDAEFRPVSAALAPDRVIDFDDLEPALARNFRNEMPVLVLNTRTDDDLDYERQPDLRAVVVGGNKLSRGLTIEGLLVSYYVRPAAYYDTLLQMGRWFGFRQSYVDLTRLWTTDELRARFRDVATVEEALRRELRLYDILGGRTPADFAPRIMAHATMQITARNRLGSARDVTVDFSGSFVQTINFQLGRRSWLEDNLTATRTFLAGLGAPTRLGTQPVWTEVDWRSVVAFLDSYQTYAGSSRVSSQLLREYIHQQADRHREVTRWTIAVRGRQQVDTKLLGAEDLHIAGTDTTACINRAREIDSEISIGTLVNPVSRGNRGGDEEIGLDEDDITAAHALSGAQGASYAMSLRRQRPTDQGLLLLYPISRYSTQQRGNGRALFEHPDRDGVTVIGMGAVLPYSNSGATVRYVRGSAGAEDT